LSHQVLVVDRILAPMPPDARLATLDDDSWTVFASEPATNLVGAIAIATDTVFNAPQTSRLLEEIDAIVRRPHTSDRVRANLRDLTAFIELARAARTEYFVVFIGN
jgi:hypothetical protein